MALYYQDVGTVKVHIFVSLLTWHQRIISLRSQSRAPTKWPARWLLINYLIFFLSFLIFKPPCYISWLAYRPIYRYIYFHTGLRTSFPKGVRNRWGGCAQVSSIHPSSIKPPQTGPRNIVIILTILPRPDKCAPKPRWPSPAPPSPSPARPSLLPQAPLLLSLEASSKSVRDVGYQ